ncbi:hypothetical protein Tsubulata_020929 [Turnera subulata]|uniref:polynucleotide adenylyltransferase n=1 Tax=Turnera subulata TaxID=218843 RepID=A0A9Q0G512_9ROSI|nr:hypothetical protein Tsubulata_020929 [Turnera subulata]
MDSSPSIEIESSSVPLYEALTLAPLSPVASPEHDIDPVHPIEPIEAYNVFRNEVSVAADDAVPVESIAPYFISLDVGEESPPPQTPKAPKPPKIPKAKLPEPEPHPQQLESGWFRGDCRFKSPMLQLHKEIVDFCDFLSPTQDERAARTAAVQGVFEVIKYIWPNCKAEVFGSFRTGLYLPTSDIDVVILDSGIKNAATGLQALSRALSQKGIAKKIQVIAKARVPIIKFVEKKSGVSFDMLHILPVELLSFDAVNGPKAADFIKDAVSKWPPIQPLCLILKVFLQQRELNEVYSGGIGSYALLAMLMAMLQNLREYHGSQELNLGILLIHFFEFYGRKLNTTDVGVSCNGKGIFFSKRKKGFVNKGRPFLIAIEDPQTPDNDIGKNSFNYFQIRAAFAMAYSTLTNPKTISGLGASRSILGTIIRPDPILTERKGGQNGEVTFNSLLPGAGEPLESVYGHQQDMMCNWQLDYEEPLPRGGEVIGDGSAESSGKKRRAPTKEKSRKKKLKENGDVGMVGVDENGSRKEMGTKKKQRWRQQS